MLICTNFRIMHKIVTLEYGINVHLCLSIFGKFSHLYTLILTCTFINFWDFFLVHNQNLEFLIVSCCCMSFIVANLSTYLYIVKIPTCMFIQACAFIVLKQISHLYVYYHLYVYSVLQSTFVPKQQQHSKGALDKLKMLKTLLSWLAFQIFQF